jgi:aspartate carbamoyltransferase catalytic subunit
MRLQHLLGIQDLNVDQATQILNTALEIRNLGSQSLPKLPTLRGKTIVNLFYEDSTRTRISFETAAKRLSADVINFSARGSSVSKGESLKDTALTLQAMGADAVVLRHPSSGAAHRLASEAWIHGSVINAGDGTNEHPTQALLDVFTLCLELNRPMGDLQGLRIAIVGDILHSRVARSNSFLMNALGAEITLISPPTLLPVGIAALPVSVSYSFDDDLNQYDVVMMLRIQSERFTEEYFPNEREYSRAYGLNAERLSQLHKRAVIMHPGPMNRGLEISARAADSERSLILNQVTNGIFLRMALLYLMLGGSAEEVLT